MPPDDPRVPGTIDAISRGLARDGWLFRYHADDGFGTPKVAFILCTFWLVEALVDRRGNGGGQASLRTCAPRALAARSALRGLRDRDLRMWGNFPQAYSHVGLIHAAFAASPKWSDVL